MVATDIGASATDVAQNACKSAIAPLRMRSLRVRLIAVSLAWVVVSLLLMGMLLIALFRGQVQRHFDQTLLGHLQELAAAAEVDANGTLKLTWEPSDPRFRHPLSGWYWEVRSGATTVKRSPSLLEHNLAASTPGPGQAHLFKDVEGPDKTRLRVLAQDIILPETDQPFTVLVAGPCAMVQQDVLTFMGQLAIALVVLALTLAALIVTQVTFGLRPLGVLHSALAEVRDGRRRRLEASGPAEIAPLIEELNGLLDERDTMVDEARAEAGDLAHALKTPIAVIRNEAHELAGERGAVFTSEASKMARVVEHHLVRARTKIKRRLAGARAPLDAVIEDVRFSLSRLYPERTVTFDVAPGLIFAGEADNLGEMIGNLADNACKWARNTVHIGARYENGRIIVHIADDGPGLDEAACSQALTRGERLGSTMPGHGFGLPIVVQLTELYGGTLRLGRSELGGLLATLDLPGV
jgi:signal transduction histidine kinase